MNFDWCEQILTKPLPKKLGSTQWLQRIYTIPLTATMLAILNDEWLYQEYNTSDNPNWFYNAIARLQTFSFDDRYTFQPAKLYEDGKLLVDLYRHLPVSPIRNKVFLAIINQYGKKLRHIAHKPYPNKDDLLAAGLLGLHEALCHFDQTYTNDPSQYFNFYIYGAIVRECHKTVDMIDEDLKSINPNQEQKPENWLNPTHQEMWLNPELDYSLSKTVQQVKREIKQRHRDFQSARAQARRKREAEGTKPTKTKRFIAVDPTQDAIDLQIYEMFNNSLDLDDKIDLAQLIGRLSDQDVDLLELYHQGYDWEIIAKELKTSKATALKRFQRILNKLSRYARE